jgi:hypothetical protein
MHKYNRKTLLHPRSALVKPDGAVEDLKGRFPLDVSRGWLPLHVSPNLMKLQFGYFLCTQYLSDTIV